MVTVKDLEAFGEAWNRHDVDAIMTFMADDCVFETTAGKEVCGTRYEGRERVREAFARVFKMFPDAHFGNACHFVAGDRGLSEWVFTGTTTEGKKLEVNGCDVFTFANGKIAKKDSSFKNLESLRRWATTCAPEFSHLVCIGGDATQSAAAIAAIRCDAAFVPVPA